MRWVFFDSANSPTLFIRFQNSQNRLTLEHGQNFSHDYSSREFPSHWDLGETSDCRFPEFSCVLILERNSRARSASPRPFAPRGLFQSRVNGFANYHEKSFMFFFLWFAFISSCTASESLTSRTATCSPEEFVGKIIRFWFFRIFLRKSTE